MQSVDVTLTLPPAYRIPVPDGVDADAIRREELLTWHVEGDAGVVHFLSLVVGDPDVVRAAAERSSFVHDAAVTDLGDDRCYVYVTMPLTPGDVAVWSALEDSRVVVVPPVVYTDTATVHATILGDPDELGDVVAAIPDDIDVEVERVSEHRPGLATLGARLTARQLEAVEAARDAGYYEVPREGSLADVADELGVSESAASALLRKAERALVDAALGA